MLHHLFSTRRRLFTILRMFMSCAACLAVSHLQVLSQPPAVPPAQEVYAAFGEVDKIKFHSPARVYYPESYVIFIGGNVSKEGITADLEAIAAAGLSGILFFHGQFGGLWAGVDTPIVCLSPQWEDAIQHMGRECRRLGLRFTVMNCPGWALAGGPWITEENAMRNLAYSRIEVDGGAEQTVDLPLPKEATDQQWRNWQDIATLAFPTPEGETEPLRPSSVSSSKGDIDWINYITGKPEKTAILPPADRGAPHWIEVNFDAPVVLRTLEMPSINSMNHGWCYEPGVRIKLEARLEGGLKEVLNVDAPQSNWQDRHPLSLACNEVGAASSWRITIDNLHQISLHSIRLYSAARKHNYESEAAWTLRSIERAGALPQQSPAAFVKQAQIRDLSTAVDKAGRLRCHLPKGKWTVLRIGHVNTGMRNAPAPPEATGWECNKLSEKGADAHFAGYIGRMAGEGGLLNGLIDATEIDSWECYSQTWTEAMEAEFDRVAGYELRRWLPAVFGYVLDDHETTTRFLRDWRATLGDLFANRFYGRMASLAHDKGLTLSYETAAGDIFPADILEYVKYADVPMCEFWQPSGSSYVGALNFKPVKPTASAARLYGKTRVAAEALTSFELTWDEHPEMLKDVINRHCIEGVTHMIFHTYTHNPQVGFLPPGTSFGTGIGTPFLRGQTWWKHMPEFSGYLARCNYLLERGRPVSDVLWYLGDEIDHKPDQNAPFPAGFKYDYCNPDVLLNRLSVRDGQIVTPEGIRYRLLWLPQNERMLPETLERILSLAQDGATVVGNAPRCLATLSGGSKAQQRFDKAVKRLWGDGKASARKVGKGRVIAGVSLDEALRTINLAPDLITVDGGEALWTHRRIDNADWYFICTPAGMKADEKEFSTRLSFRSTGTVEVWDPVTGRTELKPATVKNNRTELNLTLPRAGACFVVFQSGTPVEERKEIPPTTEYLPVQQWTLAFPEGWGAPAATPITELKAWKDLDISTEGRAFSGTATYTATFDAGTLTPATSFTLDLGKVEMIARVSLNGKPVRTLWATPYATDLTGFVQQGINTLTVEVTSSWFNRLVYDASLPEDARKTWTISGPAKDAPLRNSGLLGPVEVKKETVE